MTLGKPLTISELQVLYKTGTCWHLLPGSRGGDDVKAWDMGSKHSLKKSLIFKMRSAALELIIGVVESKLFFHF